MGAGQGRHSMHRAAPCYFLLQATVDGDSTRFIQPGAAQALSRRKPLPREGKTAGA
jgi:hypothetical protein